MKIYQCGGRLHATDAAVTVQSCGGSTKHFNTGPPSAKIHPPPRQCLILSNYYAMIPRCSILWPIEDVGTNGYCYGWIPNPRLVCVAGVLQVGSLRQCVLPHPRCLIVPDLSHTERAEALLNDFLKENPQFMKVSSTDTPVILGECSFTQSSPTPYVQYLPGVGLAPSQSER